MSFLEDTRKKKEAINIYAIHNSERNNKYRAYPKESLRSQGKRLFRQKLPMQVRSRAVGPKLCSLASVCALVAEEASQGTAQARRSIPLRNQEKVKGEH